MAEYTIENMDARGQVGKIYAPRPFTVIGKSKPRIEQIKQPVSGTRRQTSCFCQKQRIAFL